MRSVGKPATQVAPRGGPAIFSLGLKKAGTGAVVAAPVAPVTPVTPVSAASDPVASLEATNPSAALLGGQPVGTEPSPAPGMPAILAPFSGGPALLAAFVLAEALAVPVALRER